MNPGGRPAERKRREPKKGWISMATIPQGGTQEALDTEEWKKVVAQNVGIGPKKERPAASALSSASSSASASGSGQPRKCFWGSSVILPDALMCLRGKQGSVPGMQAERRQSAPLISSPPPRPASPVGGTVTKLQQHAALQHQAMLQRQQLVQHQRLLLLQQQSLPAHQAQLLSQQLQQLQQRQRIQEAQLREHSATMQEIYQALEEDSSGMAELRQQQKKARQAESEMGLRKWTPHNRMSTGGAARSHTGMSAAAPVSPVAPDLPLKRPHSPEEGSDIDMLGRGTADIDMDGTDELVLADLDSLLNDEGMPEQLEQDVGLFKSYDDEIESLLQPSPDEPEADHGLWSTVTELFGSKLLLYFYDSHPAQAFRFAFLAQTEVRTYLNTTQLETLGLSYVKLLISTLVGMPVVDSKNAGHLYDKPCTPEGRLSVK